MLSGPIAMQFLKMKRLHRIQSPFIRRLSDVAHPLSERLDDVRAKARAMPSLNFKPFKFPVLVSNLHKYSLSSNG